MSDKTIEELKAELDNLRKENLDREIQAEKSKLEMAKKAEEEKNMQMLRDEIRNQVIAEFKGTSTVSEEQPSEESTGKPANLEYDRIAKKLGFEIYDYETLTRKLSTGGYKGA